MSSLVPAELPSPLPSSMDASLPSPTVDIAASAATVSESESMSPTHPSTDASTATTTAAAAVATPNPPVVPVSPSASRSQRRDVKDGEHYANRRCLYPRACKAHTPTLEELQQHSFSEYVRQVVLEGARVAYVDEQRRRHPATNHTTTTGDNNNNNTSPDGNNVEKIRYIEDIQMARQGFPSKCPLYAEGMAKVTLPRGFWKEEGIGQDRTGRGPAWQKGTPLGDLVIPNPIKQCVRGIGGVYEYTLLDQPPIALHDFRDLADAYQQEQLTGKSSRGVKTTPAPKKKRKKQAAKPTVREERANRRNQLKEEEEKKEAEEAKEPEVVETPPQNNNNNSNSNDNEEKKEEEATKEPSIEELERKFWKRLGPTMPPATYGADMEGSLFGEDPANGWNLSRLDSFLQLLGPYLPGVTSPYLYMGMWASVFAVHTEDMNLLSINYLHAGAPKVWYAVAPGTEAKRLEALSEHYFSHAYNDCRQFLRHKRCLLSPMILKKAGIKFTMQVQYPGDAMITMPGGYHFGFNTGFNVAEATNFGVPEWVPFGHEARICNCRPDSVRIDMFRLEKLLAKFHKANKRKTSRRRKTYREWGLIQAGVDINKKPAVESESESESEEEADESNNSNNLQQQKKPRMKDFWVEVCSPVPSHQRADYGRRGTSTANKKPPAPKKRPRGKGKQKAEQKECWHLAKPMTRKGLVVNSKVLVMIPGYVTIHEQGPTADSDSSSDSDGSKNHEEDEQCFAGVITEFTEEHARVHFASLPKDDDVWMHISSSKLYLDGGRWDDSNEQKGLPPRHYWQELDSKRRCI
ncbi:specific demethylase 4A [Seminavis robusta]|uniref:Specific demethylase 4A n=1 Tax=Seminavis robusta TaxID=568900 RepID=A0A9N8E687_9STRA|nr:specific demethylase 4A [Seminavis robusta]|eukprot:Sro695_g188770.1 specific demethylase 4A (804) ;mRNA; f:41911-44322